MRIKEIFTLYPRKLKTATVYYYQCYDSSGRRTNAHSTGQRTRTAARAYCMNLYREGLLVPQRKTATLGDFAANWWDSKTCKYLEWRQVQNPLAQSTIDHYRTSLEKHIKPYFGKTRLDAITADAARNWIIAQSRKGYANSSINIHIAALKIIMKEAIRQKLIPSNPMEKIKKLQTANPEVQILKTEEAQKLLPANWRGIWDSREAYVFNKLAACTGMRPGEILGLKGENVHPNHIHVCIQYSEKYGATPLKTKDSRNIPIAAAIFTELASLVGKNGANYVFSADSGRTPIPRSRLYRETKKALGRIGIGAEERKKRRIALHHWRHFLNTTLLMANINTLKVQQITGHKSLAMTRHYAHFDSREFTEILEVQNNLLPRAAQI